jgi:hypothetical protein
MINVAALLDRWTARVCRPFNEKRKMKEREVSRQYNMDRSICKNSLIAQNLSTDDLLDAAGNLFAGYCRLEKQLKQKIDNQRVTSSYYYLLWLSSYETSSSGINYKSCSRRSRRSCSSQRLIGIQYVFFTAIYAIVFGN